MSDRFVILDEKDKLIKFRFDYDKEVVGLLKNKGVRFQPLEKYWYVEKNNPGKVDYDFLLELNMQHSFIVEAAVYNFISKAQRRLVVLSKDKQRILFYFPYDFEIKEFIKNKCYAYYKKTPRPHWYSPISAIDFVFDNAVFFKKNKFKIDKDLVELQKSIKGRRKKATAEKPLDETEWSKYCPEDYSLFEFQKAGVQYMWDKDNRVLLGDEMGLGKTVQALVALNKDYSKKKPILIIAPNTAKFVWRNHIREWLLEYEVDKVKVISSGDTEIPDDIEIVIINYAMLPKVEDTLKSMNFKTMIIDEVHNTRNTTRRRTKDEYNRLKAEYPNKKIKKKVPVKRTKIILDIGKTVDNIIAITGTPIVNKPIEIFNILKLLDSKTFSNKTTFAKMFCNFHVKQFGSKRIYDYSGASNLDKLHRLLTSTLMIRRNKKDVLKDLPEKIRTVVPVEFVSQADQSKFETYMDKIKGETISLVKKHKVGSKLRMKGKRLLFTKVSELWEKTFDYKFKQSKDFLTEILNQKEKVVVFVHHRNAYKKIETFLKKKKIKYVGISGGTPSKKRNEAERDFQTDKDVRVFLGTIGAARESLTLTAANDVVFLEMNWVPGYLTQAEDRCHRIGQEGSVNIYYLVLNESIDINMVNTIMKKINIISQIISGDDVKKDESVDMFDDFIMDFAGQGLFKKGG